MHFRPPRETTVFVNRKLREINFKVVYFGPPLSGKTTNLEYIHAHTAPHLRGELVSLKTQEDRTLFFDYLQIELGPIRGLRPKFNLYTVPGQVIYRSSRELVMRGADGVVLVLDSQRNRFQENLAALEDLRASLRKMGQDVDRFPTVFQFNKRDLPTALPLPILKAHLTYGQWPCFEAVAIKGIGVLETLKAIIQAIAHRYSAEASPRQASYPC